MNLIEIADDLKNLPDQYLMQEIQAPSGNFPTYLIVTELGRRKRMREKVAKEMPTQTVAEELATPPQMPQMGTMMPQAGLMGMPQAQTELAAQDAMGTTPPEMMMPTQQMAGGGMVSFKQGGDVIRAFDGFPEGMYEDVSPPGRGIFPAIGDYFRGGFYNDITALESLGYTPAQISQMNPEQRAIVARGSRSSATPAAVVPAAVAPTTPAAAPTAPAGAPPAAPRVAQAAVPQFQPAVIPEAMSDYARQTARAQGLSDYEQAVPDRITPFLQEAITKREGEIEGRRGSNINEALMQAGLAMMGSRSPYLLQGVSEGGLSGLKAYREGAKDLRQSEEALLASRAKMVEAQTLRDDRKFKAAEDAEKRAIELDKFALDRANTESAIALRNLQGSITAQEAPAREDLLRAQAEAYRSRPAGLDKTIATPDQIAQAKIRAMTDLAGVVKKPTQAQIDAATDAILAQSGLRRVAAGLPAVAPAAGETGARFIGFE